MDLSGHLRKLVVAKRPVVNRFVLYSRKSPLLKGTIGPGEAQLPLLTSASFRFKSLMQRRFIALV